MSGVSLCYSIDDVVVGFSAVSFSTDLHRDLLGGTIGAVVENPVLPKDLGRVTKQGGDVVENLLNGPFRAVDGGRLVVHSGKWSG